MFCSKLSMQLCTDKTHIPMTTHLAFLQEGNKQQLAWPTFSLIIELSASQITKRHSEATTLPHYGSQTTSFCNCLSFSCSFQFQSTSSPFLVTRNGNSQNQRQTRLLIRILWKQRSSFANRWKAIKTQQSTKCAQASSSVHYHYIKGDERVVSREEVELPNVDGTRFWNIQDKTNFI